MGDPRGAMGPQRGRNVPNALDHIGALLHIWCIVAQAHFDPSNFAATLLAILLLHAPGFDRIADVFLVTTDDDGCNTLFAIRSHA